MATKRQSYTTSEKLKIIKFAEEHGNRAAQREFGIAESNVRLWRKSKENLQKMPRLQRADRGRKAAWPRLEQDLMAWITEKRNNGLAILPAMVRLKALEMSKDAKYEITAGQFKASNHWCQRFMKRNGLSLRQKTTLAQRLPSDYEEKIVQFQRFIIKQRRAHSYPLHLMANMDESPIQFDMPSTLVSLASPQTAAHIRTIFLSHCFCGLMKGPIMYQQIENDVSVRAKKDNGTSGRSFNLATDFLSLFFYGGQNRNTEKSSGRKLKVFRGFFALRY